MDKNAINFGVDMSSFVHTDNKNRYILILDGVPKQGLHDTKLQQKVNILLILHNQEKDLY